MAISLKESIIVGLSDFWSRKIRSLVTIVGIVLGTMSIIVVLSLVKGINKKTLEWMMERGGLSKISVYRNWNYEKQVDVKNYFTLKEINLIRSLVPEAKYFNPQIREGVHYSYGENKYRGSIYGVIPDFKKIEEWDVEAGRFISGFDIKQNSDVIVIGTNVKEELFGNKKAVGQFITAGKRRVQIIGVMSHRFMDNSGNIGNDNALAYLNRRAFVPLSTMIHKGTGRDRINSFTVKAKDAESAPELRQKLEAIILNLRFGEPVFTIESAQEEAEKMAENAKKFRIIFFLISAISLLVGGIVIMNIMLASIQERTREIGIRLTVGARRIDIFVQFLVQTILVTTIGGILGIVSGLSILDIVSKYLNIKLIAGFSMMIIAITVSAGIGFIFGISPAIKASKLDPVVALRHE
ncbi:MAG: ABC transporter permease [Armatimonadetes bacterium]|nr:ABC transporter permease [Armatimonadota bacterium]